MYHLYHFWAAYLLVSSRILSFNSVFKCYSKVSWECFPAKLFTISILACLIDFWYSFISSKNWFLTEVYLSNFWVYPYNPRHLSIIQARVFPLPFEVLTQFAPLWHYHYPPHNHHCVLYLKNVLDLYRTANITW